MYKKLTVFILGVSCINVHANAIIAEGKTKVVRECPDDPRLVFLESKDDITAYSGTADAMHDVIVGKAHVANQTTCNVFRLLKACGIPVAFCEQHDTKSFRAYKCDMILYEVIVRREAHGSFLKRSPYLSKGHLFPQLLVEFFLKTSGQEWHGHPLPEDDPFIQFVDGKAYLYHPKKSFYDQEPFLILDDYPLKNRPELFKTMATIARQTFLVLEKAWQRVGGRLVDFKVEFGFDSDGNLLLADVIDNDSWRVVQDGNYLDKQRYREGEKLNTVTKLYHRVAELTDQFMLPRQRIIIWRGSEKDNVEPFVNLLEPYADSGVEVVCVTQSMHKEPIKGCLKLKQLVQEVPDCVVIAYVGRSNGAGPTLSAHTSVPVITVPAGWRSFSEDVWSSLRTPSKVPVMTILEPANAVLAAVQILALCNPALYMKLGMEQEARLMNVMEVA